MNKPRPIAIYLPQFHPIPENDEWWGPGFTEWTNVAKARPLFNGHYQPHLPADLSFYDLRLPETRQQQADLARKYGIYGFCFYHYWFNGRRILERPVNDVLSSGKPDFPFCLCWANENWTRRWDGKDREVLLAQHYSDDDDENHVRSLVKVFSDPRYIRINGRPVFSFYRASNIPDPKRAVENWRRAARAFGVGELYLCNFESERKDHGASPGWGFDAAIEFAPDSTNMPARLRRGRFWGLLRRLRLSNLAYRNHAIYSYSDLVERMLAKPAISYLRYPCVTPGWDNSARRNSGAIIVHGSTPELYEKWLSQILKLFMPPTPDENLIFINAWNEWAEGNHLEPCQRFGRGYLQSTQKALEVAFSPNAAQSATLPH